MQEVLRLARAGLTLALATVAVLAPAAFAGRTSRPVHHVAPAAWRVVDLPASGAHSYAEPGIAFGPHGLALIDAASANTGAPPTVWLSRNSGTTWSPGRDFDTPGVATGDADVAIGADGELYALDLGYANPPSQPANPTVLVYRSRDGRRWQGPASFPAPHGSDQPDRPWLLVDPRRPAEVIVLNSEGSGNIVAWRSTDHAQSFTGPIPVTGGPSGQAALALGSRPLIDPTQPGRMFMLYETPGPAGALPPAGAAPYEFPLTQLGLASSSDGGASWSSSLVLDTHALAGAEQDATLGHLLVASAIDRHGVIYAALSLRDPAATTTQLAVLHSSDHGASWSPLGLLAAPTRSNLMPALALAPSGAAYLSWYGSPDGDFRDPAARWQEMLASSPDLLAGHPRFAIRRLTRRPVHVGGIDAAGNVGFNLGANWGLRDLQSIALDGCGHPHPVWADDYGTPRTQTAAPLSACPACRSRRG